MGCLCKTSPKCKDGNLLIFKLIFQCLYIFTVNENLNLNSLFSLNILRRETHVHRWENRCVLRLTSNMIFYLGPFWTVGTAEKKKIQTAITMQLLRPAFYVCMGKKDILAFALKNFIIFSFKKSNFLHKKLSKNWKWARYLWNFKIQCKYTV